MVIYSLQCVAYSIGNYDKGAKSPTGVFKIFFHKIGYTTENYEMHVHGQHECNMCWVACGTRTQDGVRVVQNMYDFILLLKRYPLLCC